MDILKKPGVLLGIGGAISFALSLPLDKKAVVTSSAPFMLLITGTVLGITSIIIALTRTRGRFELDFGKNWKFFLTILFVHGAGSYLTVSALNYALVAYAASVKRLWSFWAVLFSGKFLDEKNIGKKLLATIIMLAGIAVTLILG